MKKRLSAVLTATFVVGLFAVPGTASASCTKVIEEQSGCTEKAVCNVVSRVKNVDCIE